MAVDTATGLVVRVPGACTLLRRRCCCRLAFVGSALLPLGRRHLLVGAHAALDLVDVHLVLALVALLLVLGFRINDPDGFRRAGSRCAVQSRTAAFSIQRGGLRAGGSVRGVTARPSLRLSCAATRPSLWLR